jgi:hypothetical protein
MSPSAEVSKIIGRAMPPAVVECRRSGGQNGGQTTMALWVPLRTIRGRSPRIGRCLLFGGTCYFFCALCRHLSLSVVGQWVRIEGHASSGGKRLEHSTCGCGACCRSFSYVHGSTRGGLRLPILTAQSVRTFINVHRRWGQNWGQTLATGHSRSRWTLSVEQDKAVEKN